MLRATIVGVILALCATQAFAGSTTCRSGFYGTTCTSTGYDVGISDIDWTGKRVGATASRTQRASSEEIEAENARRAKWEAFCKPEKRVDREGITRLVYAQPGCEHGRSE